METRKYGTVERKLDMLKYICLNKYCTMPELARIYNVSIRTVMRDIDDIGNFIPISTQQGRYEGGIRVMDGFSWDKAYMSDHDIQLLREVKEVGEEGRKLELSEEQLSRLDKIIKMYDKPKK